MELGVLDRTFESVKGEGERAHFSGINPCSTDCETFRDIVTGKDLTAILNFIDEKIGEIEGSGSNSLDKAKNFEYIIRFILFFRKKGVNSPELSLRLARLYFERALLIFPKAFGIPAKKTNLLKKARNELEGIHTLYDKTPDEVLKLRALVSIEMERSGERAPDYTKILEDAAKVCGNIEDDRDVEIALTACESDPRNIDNIRPFLENIYNELQNKDTCLYTARAACLLKKKDKETLLKRAIENEALSKPFSSPWWENLITALKSLSSKSILEVGWKAFEKVVSIEESLKLHNLHLIWYWSRLGELYELVIDAALRKGEYYKALYLIDSLKGRPALRWSIMEKSELRDYLEMERLGRLGYYIKGLSTPKARKENPVRELPSDLECYFTDLLPEGVTAVHLFVYKGSGRGLAFIVNKEKGCEVKEFDTEPLWEAYVRFQNSYHLSETSGRAQAFKALIDKEKGEGLLYELGNELGFLFDIYTDTLLFVPHGFLHRLPIHGAVRNGEPLIKKIKCFYYPAWSWLRSISVVEKEGDSVVFKKFEEWQYKRIYEALDGGNWVGNAGREDYLNLKSGYSQLVFLSHGESDPVDPFLSRLKLDPPLTVEDVLAAKSPDVKGAKIFIGACEADMMTPVNEALDEHISPSSAFLVRGAGAVIGTLWEANSNHIEELFGLLLNTGGFKDLLGSFSHWQGSKEFEFEEDYFEYLPFRVYLRPELLKEERNETA